MPHNLEGEDAANNLHGGDMRTVWRRHQNTSKREGRCLVRNIHQLAPNCIKVRLEFGLNLSELAFIFTKKAQPFFHFFL